MLDLTWLTELFLPRRMPPIVRAELQQAWDLIDAIDRGGIPLNPARVNAIARGLGLEVSTKSPMGHTIIRIREALGRSCP